jgi:hypothetical protein
MTWRTKGLQADCRRLEAIGRWAQLRRNLSITSVCVGIDGPAPIRCTQSDAATFAYASAWSIGTPSAVCAATAPTKQSPATGRVNALDRFAGNREARSLRPRHRPAAAERHGDRLALTCLNRTSNFDDACLRILFADFRARYRSQFSLVENKDIHYMSPTSARSMAIGCRRFLPGCQMSVPIQCAAASGIGSSRLPFGALFGLR